MAAHIEMTWGGFGRRGDAEVRCRVQMMNDPMWTRNLRGTTSTTLSTTVGGSAPDAKVVGSTL